MLLTPRHMLKVLYTVLVEFPRGAKAAEEERPRGAVRPENVKVRIRGKRAQRALVMTKLGTVPEDEQVELPVFDDSGR